jgi:hypothetical protein
MKVAHTTHGVSFQDSGPFVSPFKGKSFTEETFMATKKKAKKKKKH